MLTVAKPVPVTSVLAAAVWVFNCATFTASVSFVPAATPVMVLPPLFRPVLVRLTGVLPVDVMVTPALSTLVSPVVTLPLVPRSMFSASLTVNVSVPSATTPMLLSVKAPVAPPLTLILSPN